MVKKILLAVVMTFLFFLCRQESSASLSVSPAKFELQIQPGKSFTEAIRVVNVGDNAAEVRIYSTDFSIDQDNNLEFYDEGTLPDSLAQWLRILPRQFVLEAGEEKWVRFTVEMPENASNELRAMIFFQSAPESVKKKDGSQVLVSTRIGAVVYAAPKPLVRRMAEISELYLKENFQENALEYALVFANQGNIHLRPKGDLNILNPQGKSIIQVALNEQQAPVLGQRVRIFTGRLSPLPSPGAYRLGAEIDYGGKSDLEAEKEFVVLGRKAVEDFSMKSQRMTDQGNRLLFSVRTRGIDLKKDRVTGMIRLKNLSGELLGEMLAQVPLKSVAGQDISEWQAEWQPVDNQGIVFAELVITLEGSPPLLSYLRLDKDLGK